MKKMNLMERIKIRFALEGERNLKNYSMILKKMVEQGVNLEDQREFYRRGIERLDNPSDKAKLIVSMLTVTGDIEWGKIVTGSVLNNLNNDEGIGSFSSIFSTLEEEALFDLMEYLFDSKYMNGNVRVFFLYISESDIGREIFSSIIKKKYKDETGIRKLIIYMQIAMHAIGDRGLVNEIVERGYRQAYGKKKLQLNMTNVAFEDLTLLGNKKRAEYFVDIAMRDTDKKEQVKYLYKSANKKVNSTHLDKFVYIAPKRKLFFFICNEIINDPNSKNEKAYDSNTNNFVRNFLQTLRDLFTFEEVKESFLENYIFSFHGYGRWFLEFFGIKEETFNEKEQDGLPNGMDIYFKIIEKFGGLNKKLINDNIGKEFVISLEEEDEEINSLVGFEFFIQVVMNLHLQYEDKETKSLVVKIKEEQSLEVLSILLSNYPKAFAVSMIGSADLTNLQRINVKNKKESYIFNYLND